MPKVMICSSRSFNIRRSKVLTDWHNGPCKIVIAKAGNARCLRTTLGYDAALFHVLVRCCQWWHQLSKLHQNAASSCPRWNHLNCESVSSRHVLEIHFIFLYMSTNVLRSKGISQKSGALIMRYNQKKECISCFLLFWESFNCSQFYSI